MWKILTLICALALAGCAGSPAYESTTTGGAQSSTHSGPTGMVRITVQDFAFAPQELDVSQTHGAHFMNEGNATHTVTIFDETATQVFDAELEPGSGAHFQPPTSGAFHVICRHHTTMQADLTVL